MPFSPISEILDDLRAGKMIVLVDDEHRENEGDLVCAAQYISPEIVNFMTKYARGVLCVALDGESCDRLELTPQSAVNTAQLRTAFTVTVDAHERFGVTTGVSASDRATTIRLLGDPNTNPADLVRPGHINPLRARDGGVLVRTGQTEGSVDLCRMAGLEPAAVIIEIMNDDGSMARRPELEELCKIHDLKMCSVADIVAYRMGREKLVERIEQRTIDTEFGEFELMVYQSQVDSMPHVALCKGRVGQQVIDDDVLVRMHRQNLLGDVFGDRSQSSGDVLRASMKRIQEQGEGAIVYLRQDFAGIGRETHGGDESGASGPKTQIGIGAQILGDLGVQKLTLLTNHPHNSPPKALSGFGLQVTGHESASMD